MSSMLRTPTYSKTTAVRSETSCRIRPSTARPTLLGTHGPAAKHRVAYRPRSSKLGLRVRAEAEPSAKTDQASTINALDALLGTAPTEAASPAPAAAPAPSAPEAPPVPERTVDAATVTAVFSRMESSLSELKSLPPSERMQNRLPTSAEVAECLGELVEGGALPLYNSAGSSLARRTIRNGDLTQLGVQNVDELAVGSNRNDAAFLLTVMGVATPIAIGSTLLPGDWGFFVPYLTGATVLVVLGVGSTAPGLLQVAIDKFSQIFPDYRQRILRHEAAHFLVAYLLGVPITAYSLDLGKEHTDLLEAKMQRKMTAGKLGDEDLDVLSVISMAGIAAEGLNYDSVVGQSADLVDLQRILNSAETKMSPNEQQNHTRWSVYQACSLLKKHAGQYEALQQAMQDGKSVSECIRAIEGL